MSFLSHLDLSHNQLKDTISKNIGQLSFLSFLDLSHNLLNDTISKNIGQLSELRVLRATDNLLYGVISEDHFSKLTKLEELSLGHNSLSFNVTSDWVPPFHLQYVDLSFCKLGPNFPEWLTQENFLILDLSNTGISDVVPDSFWNLPYQFSDLNLSNNQIRANEFYSLLLVRSGLELNFTNTLTFANNMDLSTNCLDGEIPESIVNLVGLQSLNLSGNHLTGQIPTKIGDMESMLSLDLSRNSLSGLIPPSLTELTFLGDLNLSFNNLSGRIPRGSQLQTFTDATSKGKLRSMWASNLQRMPG
ncbi:hypothetical protein QJS04_geneDACA024663 [Acorus gramineus]|uniref:Leucine-rich repeat and WD repeat-containing protein 1 LRR domain-containing protein n=1 Tax=Acorus gramineus TaxID=55184 RepID=A0AAV9AM55_ACOGR|nr:hypothetical protein QJS04_geneDACA024663 [Acorus gramineus]